MLAVTIAIEQRIECWHADLDRTFPAPVDADAHGRGLRRTSDQMQLCRREAHANPSARRAKDQRFLPARPTSIQLVLVQFGTAGLGEGVGCLALPGRLCAVLRRGMRGAEIDLGCANAGQVGIVRRMFPRAGARKAEQAANGALDLLGISLAFANKTNLSIPVQKVERRPGPIFPCVPGSELVVLGDGVAYAQLADGALDIWTDALEPELGRVDADDLAGTNELASWYA